jgi:hypothetical protein
MSNVTFKIEKDTRWNSLKLTTDVKYYVWAGTECLGLCFSEEEAVELYEAAKKSYSPRGTEIVKEETVETL